MRQNFGLGDILKTVITQGNSPEAPPLTAKHRATAKQIRQQKHKAFRQLASGQRQTTNGYKRKELV